MGVARRQMIDKQALENNIIEKDKINIDTLDKLGVFEFKTTEMNGEVNKIMEEHTMA